MTASRPRSILRGGLCALIVLAPLPFGSVTPVGLACLAVGAFVLGAGAFVVHSFDAVPLSRKARLMRWPVAAILVVGAVQLLPLPEGWIAVLSRPSAEARAEVGKLVPELAAEPRPVSLDPVATRRALVRFGAYAALGFAAYVSVRRRRHLRQVLVALFAAAAFQALYGAAEYLSGHQHIFGYAKRFHLESATGTFVNRNHFAAYLAMLLPASLAILVHLVRRVPRVRAARGLLLSLDQPALVAAVASGLGAMAVWAGIVLSSSRAGLVTALAGVATFALVGFAGGHRLRRLAPVLVVPVIVLGALEVRAPGERFLAGGDEIASLHGRLPVWKAAGGLASAAFPAGVGIGGFAAAFPLIRPAGIQSEWDHAHNDWLQAGVEGGPVVFLAAVAMFAIALSRSPLPRKGRVLWAAVPAGCVAIGLSGTIDFCAHIPAVAATGAVLLGLACVRPPSEHPE